MVQFHNIGTMVNISVPLEDNFIKREKGIYLVSFSLTQMIQTLFGKFLHEHKEYVFYAALGQTISLLM